MKTYSFKVVLEKDKWPDDPDFGELIFPHWSTKGLRVGDIPKKKL